MCSILLSELFSYFFFIIKAIKLCEVEKKKNIKKKEAKTYKDIVTSATNIGHTHTVSLVPTKIINNNRIILNLIINNMFNHLIDYSSIFK